MTYSELVSRAINISLGIIFLVSIFLMIRGGVDGLHNKSWKTFIWGIILLVVVVMGVLIIQVFAVEASPLPPAKIYNSK